MTDAVKDYWSRVLGKYRRKGQPSMNSMSEARLQALYPVLRERWRAVAAESEATGLPLVILRGLWTYDQQAEEYARGRSRSSDLPCRHHGIIRPIGTCSVHPLGATVTNTEPGFSQHQFGLAIDPEPDDPAGPGAQPDWNRNHPGWGRLVLIAQKHGLAEGAPLRTLPQYPHFYPVEIPAVPTDEQRELYRRGGIEAVWKWADERIADTKRI